MKHPADLIHQEQKCFSKLLAGFVIAVISGFSTYLYQTHGVWQQWTYLLHTLVGIFLALLLAPYVYIHFKRTLGIRRASVLITGFISIIALTCLVISGLHISTIGQQKALRWVNDAHIICAYLTFITLLAHLCAHRFVATSKRRPNESSWFPSITPLTFKVGIRGTIMSLCIILIATLLYNAIPTVYLNEEAAQHQGNIPFTPGHNITSTSDLLDNKHITGSDQCGTCHREIADQWRASMHSQATSDITYQITIDWLANKYSKEAISYCDSCHLPPSTLGRKLTTVSTTTSSALLNEGVNCMSCHGVSLNERNKDEADFIFKPANDYLFANRDTSIATKLHNYLIHIQPRQHRLDMLSDSISKSQFCGTCHTQHIKGKTNNSEPVIIQDEFNAWLESSFSGQGQKATATSKKTRCQDCHMPLVFGHDPSANKSGQIHSHRTLGANTAIPWYNGDKEQLRLTTEFLQTDKVRISIEEPSRISATRSRRHVSPTASTEKDAPAYYYLGETANLEVVITNSQVGHDFPGGTTDINEVWVELAVVDAQNNIVYKSGAISDNNEVDPSAHFYRSIPIDGNSKSIWQHDLFAIAGYSSNKSIPSGASDVITYTFPVPSWVKSPLTVSAVLRYRKFNNRYASWVFNNNNIQIPITDVARNAISIPVRTKHEIGN